MCDKEEHHGIKRSASNWFDNYYYPYVIYNWALTLTIVTSTLLYYFPYKLKTYFAVTSETKYTGATFITGFHKSIGQRHDDVIKWKLFSRNWPFVQGIPRSPGKSPHKGQWRGALMFSLICAQINGSVNNCETGDLRRHCAHFDVTVMIHRCDIYYRFS